METWQRQLLTDEFLDVLKKSPQWKTQYSQTFAVPPPPEEFIITFIGGPKNATQLFMKRKENPQIRDGERCRFMVIDEPNPFIYEDRFVDPEVFSYTCTFIPLSQTPFTNAQCVVAVFLID